MDETLVERAKQFALKAHSGTFEDNLRRKPIAGHLEEVARLVELSGGSSYQIAAAWLHDVVEDTNHTLDELRELFGD
jgi:GTP diphosphokinase / guanosine-3',5'-bis(diphosphate) 3'-diphosphatase